MLVACAGVLSLPFGCTGALGLDDREDAVAALCQCSEQLPSFDDCRALLTERLGFAAPAVRAAWLQYYAVHCGDSCGAAYACYAQPGTCASLSCNSHQECCGYDSDSDQGAYCDMSAAAPSCRVCSWGDCTSDADCCVFQHGDEGSGACRLPQRKCRAAAK